MYERFISSSMLTGWWDAAKSDIGLATRSCELGAQGWGLEPADEEEERRSLHPYTSRFLTSSALSSMNLRRGSTWSPISVVNIRSATGRSCALHWSRVRFWGSIVVVQSISGFISPRPL